MRLTRVLTLHGCSYASPPVPQEVLRVIWVPNASPPFRLTIVGSSSNNSLLFFFLSPPSSVTMHVRYPMYTKAACDSAIKQSWLLLFLICTQFLHTHGPTGRRQEMFSSSAKNFLPVIIFCRRITFFARSLCLDDSSDSEAKDRVCDIRLGSIPGLQNAISPFIETLAASELGTTPSPASQHLQPTRAISRSIRDQALHLYATLPSTPSSRRTPCFSRVHHVSTDVEPLATCQPDSRRRAPATPALPTRALPSTLVQYAAQSALCEPRVAFTEVHPHALRTGPALCALVSSSAHASGCSSGSHHASPGLTHRCPSFCEIVHLRPILASPLMSDQCSTSERLPSLFLGQEPSSFLKIDLTKALILLVKTRGRKWGKSSRSRVLSPFNRAWGWAACVRASPPFDLALREKGGDGGGLRLHQSNESRAMITMCVSILSYLLLNLRFLHALHLAEQRGSWTAAFAYASHDTKEKRK
ncbi:hypothetical protein M5K25_014850 [Dendrobium thyrsiflorum]|uniref:Uncharacterized protein n=1 Tax=Dendrobium thyrsiflorum TaxID=117978 RepID=A0ABD0UW17_DENTH